MYMYMSDSFIYINLDFNFLCNTCTSMYMYMSGNFIYINLDLNF